MSKLWCFGDSYTQGYNPNVEWSKEYIKFKGYIPKVYSDFLSERLDIENENLGVGGYDNYSIFEVLCKNIDKIKENDIVIIGWSNVSRFRMASKDGDWVRFVPGTITDFHISHHTDLSKNTIEEICVNRDNEIYFNEVNSWIKFINQTMKKNKVIHWTPFDGNLNVHKILKLETTNKESNGKILDHHYSENSHKFISDLFFEIIKGKLI
jgi:hypothetical protein